MMPYKDRQKVRSDMYTIVLTNGKIINIKADEVEWCGDKERMAKFINNRCIVARINMENVVGWIAADYKVENEVQE